MRISDWSSDVCSSDLPLDEQAQAKLTQLLDYGVVAAAEEDSKNALVLRVVPRLGTVSPWASKATDIVHNFGLAAVRRIERGIRYTITPSRGLVGSKKRSEEHTSELQSLMRISYAVLCLKKKKN